VFASLPFQEPREVIECGVARGVENSGIDRRRTDVPVSENLAHRLDGHPSVQHGGRGTVAKPMGRHSYADRSADRGHPSGHGVWVDRGPIAERDDEVIWFDGRIPIRLRSFEGFRHVASESKLSS
jgi:hypothetical protein